MQNEGESCCLEDFVAAAVKDEDALEEVFDTALEVPQDVKLTEGEVKEERDVGEKLQNGNGQSACPPAAGSSSTEPEWAVGAECRVVWSEDGQVYPAVVVSVDGERRRVRFIGYGNEEDMEVSALKTSDAEPQPLSSQDWKPGSRCRAVFSEDGLVYPAVVLWVKGQRCRIRFDEYNNEEEQDVSGLLNPDELYGPSRAKGGRKSIATSTNFDFRRRRREENQGERGGERRPAWRDDQQNSSWVKERPGNQSKVEKEADERRRGNQQRDGAEKPTNHSFPFFPPFPPPPPFHSSSGDPLPFLPLFPPPLPAWMFGGKESGTPSPIDATSSIMMLWYMCGFHTGSYLAQQQFRSTSKD
ncbi:survival motor neuron protein-like isoform X2 [Acanthochromis polyacanthus]|uniref:Survival motor neuron protein-like n=1 Tax=Acanthochromis polyacanthus TaxID=80966 RepID=A0A3Q1F1U5_9TELE|nr:survival motor neuron protein-like isoform X2 [Acanthochromis polyacanthus]